MNNWYICNTCGSYVQQHAPHVCSNMQIGYIEPIKCEHCYCLPAWGDGGTSPHRQCCKCGNIMAEEFINFKKLEK